MDIARDLLRQLPVSINNLADPAILRDSSAAKLDQLVEDRHQGPVALITKGDFSTPWWRERLPHWARHLDLYVFASISNLPKSIEPVGQEQRYHTLRAARDAGAKAIAYLRPIIHTVNDDPVVIETTFRRAIDSGCHAIVSSGFRGDDEVIDSTGIRHIEAPDGQHWSRILKLTPQRTSDFMRELSIALNVPYWTRTLCAVAALGGKEKSLNPYYIADKFVGCQYCPLQGSCEARAQFHQPLPHSVELLRYLGFQVEVHTASERYRKCDVVRRQDCTLCCTNCPVAPANYGVPYINIRAYDGSVPTWGEMSFARFLTGGILATDPHIPPGEDSRVRLHPRFRLPDGSAGQGTLYGVNSWMVWSEYVPPNKCFRCSYCFLKMFEDILPPEYRITVGMSPSRILDYEDEAARTCDMRTARTLPVIELVS